MRYLAQTTKWLRLALTVVLALGVRTTALGQTSTMVDEAAAAAAAAVRLYEKDPTLVLPAPRQESKPRNSLLFVLEDGRRYGVDARTGRVWRALYPRRASSPGAKDEISPQQAEEIARGYAAEHFAEFMLKFTKARVTDGGATYTVEFRQQVPGTGAELPNFAMVAVDAVTGAVTVVTIHDGNPIPSESADRPAIGQDEAVRIAAQAAGMTGVTDVVSSRLRWVRHNGDRLVWSLMLKGVFPGDVRGQRVVAVDARTANVISLQKPESPDYRLVQGPDGPEMEIAQGPAVPAAGSLDGAGGSSSVGLPPAAAAGLGFAALVALAVGAFYLFRRRGGAVTGARGADPV